MFGKTKATILIFIGLFCLLAFPGRAQTALGKHPADKVLDNLFSGSNGVANANTIIDGINARGTHPGTNGVVFGSGGGGGGSNSIANVGGTGTNTVLYNPTLYDGSAQTALFISTGIWQAKVNGLNFMYASAGGGFLRFYDPADAVLSAVISGHQFISLGGFVGDGQNLTNGNPATFFGAGRIPQATLPVVTTTNQGVLATGAVLAGDGARGVVAATRANIRALDGQTNTANWKIWVTPTTNYMAESSSGQTLLSSNDFSGLLQGILNQHVTLGYSLRVDFASGTSGNSNNYYTVSNTVYITNGVIFSGQGNASSIFAPAPGLTTPMFQIGADNNFLSGITRFENIRFQGDAGGATSVGVLCRNVAEPNFFKCEWNSFKKAGLQFSQTNYNHWSQVNDCWFVGGTNTTSHDILIDASPQGTTELDIVNCKFQTQAGSAITVSNYFRNLKIQGCSFRDDLSTSLPAVRIFQGEGFQIANNSFFEYYGAGVQPIRFEDRGAATNVNAVLSGNLIRNYTGGPTSLIYIGTNVNGVNLIGNNNPHGTVAVNTSGQNTNSARVDVDAIVTPGKLSSSGRTNTSILTKILGTTGNGTEVGATLSGVAWDGTTLSTLDLTTNAANTFTGANLFTRAQRLQTDLNGGTALNVGQDYFDQLSGNRTLTFSGTPTDGDVMRLTLDVLAAGTLTFPSSYVLSPVAAVTTATAVNLWVGKHTIYWFRTGDGAGGSYWLVALPGALQNLGATVDPTTTDDATKGYGIGSLWVNTSSGTFWMCLSPTASSAVWHQIDAGSAPSDTAFAASWNGVTTIAPSKNAVYDWAHLFDTDDDGLPDKLDLAAAGFVRSTAGGVISSAELSGDVTTSGSAATTVVKINGTTLSGLATGLLKNTTGTGVPSIATAGTDYTSPTSTESFQNKTLDAAATGNTLKFKKYLYFRGFDNVTGAIPVNTNDYTAITFMRPQFLNGTVNTANYIEWHTTVPEDIDTSVALRAKVKFRLTGADTGSQRYVLQFASVADSASAAGTVGTAVNLDFAGDASGASGDVESVGYTTLTSWAAGLTAGQEWVVRLGRDGTTSDTSTVDSQFMECVVEYGVTQ